MTEAKREVWAVERFVGNEWLADRLTFESKEDAEHETQFGFSDVKKRVVRYVPESAAQPSEQGWVAVDEWTEESGCVAVGYDRFYGRVGEVERSPGSRRWVFVDSQKDDCDVTHVRPLPSPPKGGQ